MEAQEPKQELKELETSLRNNPNRYRSFAGAARAADRAVLRELVSLAGNADTARRSDSVSYVRYFCRADEASGRRTLDPLLTKWPGRDGCTIHRIVAPVPSSGKPRMMRKN
jgi:hypothetical protein